jgi:hypothetical protein
MLRPSKILIIPPFLGLNKWYILCGLSWGVGSCVLWSCVAVWEKSGEMMTASVKTYGLFAWLISHQQTVLFSQNKPAISN